MDENSQAPQDLSQPDVNGSVQTPPSAESQVTEVQPDAPNPVPATAEPSQDQVTVNTTLNTAAERLQEVADFVKNHLSFHDVAESVVRDVEMVVSHLKDAVK
jgi:hypothetical protein